MSIIESLSCSNNLPEILDIQIKCYVQSRDWLSDKQFIIHVNEDDEVHCSYGDESDQLVPELCGKHIDEFFCGSDYLFAKNTNNEIYGWDRTGKHMDLILSENKQKSIQKLDFFHENNINIAEICCGSDHCLALSFNGMAYGWGSNRSGQFGSKIKDDWVNQPVCLNNIYFGNSKVKNINCKQNNSFFITNDGKVYAFNTDFETNPLILTINGAKKLSYSSGPRMSSKCAILTESGQLSIYNVSEYPSKVLRKETKVLDIDDIPWDDSKLLAECEECLYELTDNNLGTIEKNKTDYINYYDYMLNKFKCTVKTIHVSKEGFLFINCLQLNDNHRRNPAQNLLTTEIKNVFNRKFDNKFEVLDEIPGGKDETTMYKVKCRKTNKEFAIKCFEINDNMNLNEIKLMLRAKSKHVVKLHDSWVECQSITKKNITKYMFIQMDFCLQNLRQFLEDSHENEMTNQSFTQFNYYISFLIFEELTDCLKYLHDFKPPIMHRDIKPENVLISDGTDGTYFKLCDFEFAKIHEKSSHTRGVGTNIYTAPEVLDGRQYNFKSDVYSLALVVTEIFNLNDPVYTIREKNNINEYLNRFREHICKEKIDSLQDLLNKCLFTEDYSLRPSCEQIKNEIKNLIIDKNDLKNIEGYSQFKEEITRLDDCPFKTYCMNKIL